MEDEALAAGGLRLQQRPVQALAPQELEHGRPEQRGVGPPLDHVAPDVVGAHHAARAIRGVEHQHLAHVRLQLEGRGQARHPRPDHDRADLGSAHAQTVLLNMGRPDRRCSGR